MIASGFLHLHVKRDRRGNPVSVSFARVTQRHPSGMVEAGDIVVRVELDIDGALLKPTVLEGKVPPGVATIVLEVKDTAE